MYRAILCLENHRPIHVPDLPDSNELFQHCYELQKIFAPAIPTFMIYHFIAQPTEEDRAIIEQTKLIDQAVALRKQLYLGCDINYMEWLWSMGREELTAVVDQLQWQLKAWVN